MRVRFLFLILAFASCLSVRAQKDTASWLTDTTILDEAFFNDLDHFMDSLLTPRSLFLANVSAGSATFHYTAAQGAVRDENHLLLQPSVGYFDKSGLGINASASVVKEPGGFNAYQFSGTASYDYLKSRKFMTGLSVSRFFTKDSLHFYASPLQNELQAYFTYRKWWLRPAVSATYGWGTKKEVQQKGNLLTALRIRNGGGTQVVTQESISDFNLVFSVRHDFYWRKVLAPNGYFRFSPQLNFVSGTQSYGFNQSSSSYGLQRFTATNGLFRSKDVTLAARRKFQPLALCAYLKTEMAIRKFFVQPQLLFNYNLQHGGDRLMEAVVVNTGFIF